MVDERRIRQLRAKGSSIREIAEILKIKRKEVDNVLSTVVEAEKVYEQQATERDNDLRKTKRKERKAKATPASTSVKKVAVKKLPSKGK